MKKEKLNFDYLEELSQTEMINIDGGDWIRDFGAACHRAWCKVKDAASSIADTYSQNVGNLDPSI